MFRSAGHAFSWAYTIITIDIVQMSSINKMAGKGSSYSVPNDLLVGIKPQEARQQAEQIINVAYQLDDKALTEYLIARYGKRYEEEYISRLIERVLMMAGAGSHYRQGIRKLIMCYFGVDIKRDDIRAGMRCDNNKLTALRKQVYDALDRIGRNAVSEACEVFAKKGIVGAKV